MLDEISEMNVGVQAKLLRVLQEHEFERVGGSQTLRVDCRVIATTNRNLKEYAEEGRFRKDLFFRLNVVPLHVPPLRERKDDIPMLIDAIVGRFMQAKGRKGNALRFNEEAIRCLQEYSWPGNVRELENLIERLCVMEEGPELGLEHLPPEIANHNNTVATSDIAPPQTTTECLSIPEMERRTIMQAMQKTGGNQRKTAQILQISVRTLRNKLKIYRTSGNMTPSAT